MRSVHLLAFTTGKTTAGRPLRRMLLPAVCLLLADWRLLAAWRLQLEEPEQRAQLTRLGCSGSSLGVTSATRFTLAAAAAVRPPWLSQWCGLRPALRRLPPWPPFLMYFLTMLCHDEPAGGWHQEPAKV